MNIGNLKNPNAAMKNDGDAPTNGKKLSLPQFLALLERKDIVPNQFSAEEAKARFASFAKTDGKSLYFSEFRACMHSFYDSTSSKKPQWESLKTQGLEGDQKERNGTHSADLKQSERSPITGNSRRASPEDSPITRSPNENQWSPKLSGSHEGSPAVRDSNTKSMAETSSRQSSPSTLMKGRLQKLVAAGMIEGENSPFPKSFAEKRDIAEHRFDKPADFKKKPLEKGELNGSPRTAKDESAPVAVKLELDYPYEQVNAADPLTFCNDLVLDLADALGTSWDRIQVLRVLQCGDNTAAIVNFRPSEFKDEASPVQLISRLKELVMDESDDNLLFNGEVSRFLLHVTNENAPSPNSTPTRLPSSRVPESSPGKSIKALLPDPDGSSIFHTKDKSPYSPQARGQADVSNTQGRMEAPKGRRSEELGTSNGAVGGAGRGRDEQQWIESSHLSVTMEGVKPSRRRNSMLQRKAADLRAQPSPSSKESQDKTSKSKQRRHSIALSEVLADLARIPNSNKSKDVEKKNGENGSREGNGKGGSPQYSRKEGGESKSGKFSPSTVASMVFLDDHVPVSWSQPSPRSIPDMKNGFLLDPKSDRRPSTRLASAANATAQSSPKSASHASSVKRSSSTSSFTHAAIPSAKEPMDLETALPTWEADKEGHVSKGEDRAAFAHVEIEGPQCKVLFNDDEGNAEVQKQARKDGMEMHKNSVTTSKYTFYNFIFLNLGQQFSRLANVYFLVIAALQLLTPLSPTGRYSTAAPLGLVVLANMVREIWEDSKRHTDDKVVNHRRVDVIKHGHAHSTYWKDVRVGDIVCIRKGNEVPADVLQLSSSDEQGGSYIDTCNLDGETNLKLKSSLSATKQASSADQVCAIAGTLEYEAPNKRLYTFVGTAVVDGEKIPVDNDCVLLRGSVLRNTDFTYGIVIYAGKQSKIQMNSKSVAIKRSNVEKMANWILAGVLFFELVMCCLGCIGNAVWAKANKSAWYMPYVQGSTSVDVLQAWVTYFILLNNYVPISLYVSMELAKLGQKILMDNDLEMYHEATDTPCLARTSNLNEELGQIQYIFSDKTGTLTRNEMEFRKCWIAGTSYGFGTTEIGQAAAARGAVLQSSGEEDAAQANADAERAQFFYDAKIGFDDVRIRQRLEGNHPHAPVIRDFLRVLSVAHTVVPEADADGSITPETVKFQAESPDEGALVTAAKVLGYFFCGKTATTHTVNVYGKLHTFEILNINKFTSTRKRMSAVVRTPEGRLELYIKGADNVMFERLSKEADKRAIEDAVKGYGGEGLRTLIIAKRLLSPDEYARWNRMHRDAATALTGREEKLSAAAEAVERDLEILGATAIEDKLQVGVPEAIATLAKAGIRIWVLTGDKQETAENIGFACNLLNDGMHRIYLVHESFGELEGEITKGLQDYALYAGADDPCEGLALVVDGKALLVIMKAVENPAADSSQVRLMEEFLRLARMCKAVIACRVSPDQKRQIVAMVKLHSTPVPLTLAIGDGANDVPMILEASVGVGISGNEGMQAVRSADYAIAQFAFLKRLLLVHGRANYKRVSTVVMYSLYKNCFLVTTLFLYGVYTGWTGTALFDSLMLAGFNVGWAFVGIIVFGVIENDVSPAAALRYPQLYMTGVRKRDFNMGVLVRWEVLAFLHTVLCLLIPVYAYKGSILRRTGEDDGQTVVGMCVLQCLVMAVNLKLLLSTANLTYPSLVACLGGIVLFMFGGLTHSTWGLSSFFASEEYVFYNVMPFLYATATTWLIQLLTVTAILLPEVATTYYTRTYSPAPADIVREIDQGYGTGPRLTQDSFNAAAEHGGL